MLLVGGFKVQQEESIRMVRSYAFINETQSRQDSQHKRDPSQRHAKAFNVHHPVHLSMRSRMKSRPSVEVFEREGLNSIVRDCPLQ